MLCTPQQECRLDCRSIGNISPLLEKEYPNCWKKYTSCGKTLTEVRCLCCAGCTLHCR